MSKEEWNPVLAGHHKRDLLKDVLLVFGMGSLSLWFLHWDVEYLCSAQQDPDQTRDGLAGPIEEGVRFRG
jgi:hypothetical protein